MAACGPTATTRPTTPVALITGGVQGDAVRAPVVEGDRAEPGHAVAWRSPARASGVEGQRAACSVQRSRAGAPPPAAWSCCRCSSRLQRAHPLAQSSVLARRRGAGRRSRARCRAPPPQRRAATGAGGATSTREDASARAASAPPPASTCWLMTTRWREHQARRAGTGSVARVDDRAAIAARRLVQADLAQQVEVGEHLPRPQHHRRERVLGHRDGQRRSPRAAACRGSSAASRRR